MQTAAEHTLLERDDEIGRLDAVVGGLGEARGQLLLFEGPAGIGKSALLEAGAEMARTRGHRVLVARGGELERDFGYGIVRQMLEPVIRRADAGELERLFSGAAALAGPIVSAGEPAIALGSAGPDAAYAAQHGLYWLVDNLATRAPVLLVVDDAQWADLASLQFLLYLTRRLDGLRAAALVGWRLGEAGSPASLLEALRAEPLAEVASPAPLSSSATRQLVGLRMPGAGGHRFPEACHATTGGNPFLLEELLLAVEHGELPATEDAVSRVRELGPAAISRNVFVRLSRMPPEAGALARAVAVLDVDSDPVHAARLAELDPEVAVAVGAALEAAGIFARSTSPRFAHPILRGAVYGDLGRAEQERLHRAAARILDDAGAGDRAAAHLLLTQPSGDRWVVERLVRAAERGIERGAAQTALGLLRRALAEPPVREDMVRVLLALGTAEQLTGEAMAADRLRAAMNAADDAGMRRQIAFGLARQLNVRLRHAEAVEVLESLLPEQPHSQPEVELELEAHIAFNGLMADAAAPEAGNRIERIAAGCSGATPAEGMVLVAAAFQRALAMRGTAAEATDMLERARVRERFPAMLARTSTAFWACGALLLSGRVEDARELSDDLLAAARRTGGTIWVSAASIWRGWAALMLGDIRDAAAYVNDCFDAADGRFPLVQPGAVGVMAEILQLQGELDAADGVLAGYGFATEPGPRHATAAYLPKARCALRTEQRRLEDALRDVNALLESERERGGLQAGVLPAAALALHAAGDVPAALEVARREVANTERWGVPAFHGTALRVLGVIEGGEAGLERLRESVSALDGSVFRLELALSLTEYGAALRRSNQRQAARDPLAAGLDLAQRCGALALAARAADELSAAGARPRSLMLSGIDSLTPSERRVAQLAVQGLSNREIAQELFVTKKTVETHLRHVFQKLDVKARTELRDALEPAAPMPAPLALPRARTEEPAESSAPLERPVVRTVLLVDIVDSARRQSQLGDRRWRDLQTRYEELFRRELAEYGGDELKMLGDGFLATFESATAAVRCAERLVAIAWADLGLRLRSGVHCGEVEFRDGDVRGIAVTIAARVMGLAEAGEVLCSGTIADLAVGSELRFAQRATVALKGVPGRWRICAAG